MEIIKEISKDSNFFNMIEQLILPTSEEADYLFKHLSKGTNVALDKIKAFLPDCPSFIGETAFQNFQSSIGVLSNSRKTLNGWGKDYLPKQFNLKALGFYTERKEEVKSSGFLSYITSPSTKTILTNLQVSEISEKPGIFDRFKEPNKMIHLAWHENGKTCEKLTSTLAHDHVISCYEGSSNFPLLEQVCNWDPSQVKVEPQIQIEPPKGAIELWGPTAARVAGCAFGTFALYKAVQNVRAEGYANKARALLWATAGVAAFVLAKP